MEYEVKVIGRIANPNKPKKVNNRETLMLHIGIYVLFIAITLMVVIAGN